MSKNHDAQTGAAIRISQRGHSSRHTCSQNVPKVFNPPRHHDAPIDCLSASSKVSLCVSSLRRWRSMSIARLISRRDESLGHKNTKRTDIRRHASYNLAKVCKSGKTLQPLMHILFNLISLKCRKAWGSRCRRRCNYMQLPDPQASRPIIHCRITQVPCKCAVSQCKLYIHMETVRFLLVRDDSTWTSNI